MAQPKIYGRPAIRLKNPKYPLAFSKTLTSSSFCDLSLIEETISCQRARTPAKQHEPPTEPFLLLRSPFSPVHLIRTTFSPVHIIRRLSSTHLHHRPSSGENQELRQRTLLLRPRPSQPYTPLTRTVSLTRTSPLTRTPTTPLNMSGKP
jgi:hypothetical protein